MPSIKAVKKLTKSKKNSESQREKEALEAQARARELAEQMVADETELNWYQEELAMYDQRQVGGKSNKNDQVGVGTGEYDDYGGLGGGAAAGGSGGMTTGGGGPMSTQPSTMDYFLSHDDAALDDEVKITPEERDNLVDVELFHDPDMTAAGSAAAAAIVSGEANNKNKEKSSGGKARKKMSLLRRSKSAKNKSKSSTTAAAASTSGAATAAAAEDYTKDQDQYSYNSDHQPPSRDESIDDLLGFGEDQVQRDAFEMLQHQLPPPPSAPISAVEEFTARRSARVASNYTTADGDTWVENLAVVELPNVKEAAGGKGKSGSRSLLRRSRNTSNAAESEEAAASAAAAAAEDEESPIGRLAIRPYFQSIKTGMRVWDEPPTGASNVQYASAEVRKMAELQMADMRHNAEAVMEARSVAKLMKEEREAKEGSSGGRSSVIKKSLKKKLGKKKKKGDSAKRPYKTAEDLGITQSPQRSSRPPSERKAAPTNEFELYDEDMQIAIAMSIGNDGVISRYDEVSERNNSTAATGGGAGVGGNDDEALAMAISLSEQEDRQKQQQSTQEDLLMKLALEESSKMGERNVSSSSSAAASLPQDETTATSTEKKSKKDKRKNRFRSSSRRSSAQKSGDAGMYDHSYDGGGKMPARVGIGGELEDNPYEGGEQYASDFSSSSMEGGGGTTPRQTPPMYPPGTSIDDLLGNGGGGPDTPRHRTYSHQSYQSHASHTSHQSEGYLGVGYEQGAEERLNTMASNPATSSNMSITSASSMSTRSEHRGGGSSGNRRSKYQNRHRTYSHETSGSIPSIQSVDHASVDLLDVAGVPGTESDHSHSDSLAGVGGIPGGGGGIPGVPGAASGEAGGEYYTDGEASAASVSSALRKKLGDAVVSSGKKIATARKKKGEQPSLEDSADAAGLV